MKADFLYSTVLGRMLFKCLQKAGFFRLAAWFLHTSVSRLLIPGYIKSNDLDMQPFAGQAYDSFADFFARKRNDSHFSDDPEALITPCDSLLSIYPVTEDMTIPMKGSLYTLTDLVPDEDVAPLFRGGLCLIFRLQASDYHHFCCIDDGTLLKTVHIPGQLHSVQPIALRHFPVFRLNRRWWSVLETEHFGTAVQIEIGAMMVGGVCFSVGEGSRFRRGDEMGHFELAGSTIAVLLDASAREKIVFDNEIMSSVEGRTEVAVRIGSVIGRTTK